jgi:hypothetical protein
MYTALVIVATVVVTLGLESIGLLVLAYKNSKNTIFPGGES